MMDVLAKILWCLIWLPVVLFVVVLLAFSYASIAFTLKVRKLARTPCLRCGRPIGRAAVDEARRESAEEFEKLRKEHPGMRLRHVAIWHLRCPHCGYRMAYKPDEERLYGEDARAETDAGLPPSPLKPTAGPEPDG